MEEHVEILISLAMLAVVFSIVWAFFSSPRKESEATLRKEPKPTFPPPRTEQDTDYRKVKVLWVIDGDTVIVGSLWRETKVRLDAIDCPEDGQPWGNIAKAGLIKLIGGREILLEEHGVDYYGRTLATFYLEDRGTGKLLNVNERMVTLGHAWVMRKCYDHLPNDRKAQLDRLERWARSRKVGLWRAPDPIPPWQWRRGTDSDAY